MAVSGQLHGPGKASGSLCAEACWLVPRADTEALKHKKNSLTPTGDRIPSTRSPSPLSSNEVSGTERSHIDAWNWLFTRRNAQFSTYLGVTSKMLTWCKFHKSSHQWRTQEFFSGGGSTNSVEDRGQRERGSGCGGPQVRGSGGSYNLVQEISFHIVKFS
jgi:hypothetical protein